MKIKLTDPETNHLNTAIDIKGQEVELEDVFTGVGIQTDQGLFGIAQRDGGVQVLNDGEIVYPLTFAQLREQLGKEILDDQGMEIAYRSNVAMLLHDHFNEADFTDHDIRNEAASMILRLILRSSEKEEAHVSMTGSASG